MDAIFGKFPPLPPGLSSCVHPFDLVSLYYLELVQGMTVQCGAEAFGLE